MRIGLANTKEAAVSGIIVGVAIYIALAPMLIKHSKRYLILNESCIQFRSFHINKKYRDADVDYASIQRISKCFYPNLKGFCLSLKTTEYENNILIDATINDSRELFTEICNRVKSANPNVKISKKVIEYLSKEGEPNEG